MRRILIAATILISATAMASAQSLDDLNLQFHGYVTQGFIYTNQNNWNTTDSSDGSAAWTEAVLNLTAQPEPKLRIGIQARYSLLGTFGNSVTLDWAQLDYKVNEHFGLRAGKVKSPMGMLNETQDVDPAQLWILLPQSIYPVASRNSTLAHYGGVVYGTVSLGESFGKLDYRAYGGERVVASDDGYLQSLRDAGFTLPNGVGGPIFGGTLRWNSPVRGLMLGATESTQKASGEIVDGPLQGTITAPSFCLPYFFGKYERNRLMLGGEYNRWAGGSTIVLPYYPPVVQSQDQRAFYLMGSYKLATKLTGGLYYSSSSNRQAAFTSMRYQKDWALTARFDFNSFLYAKVEQHFIDGTEIGFSTTDNLNLQPSTRMSLLKLGVSF